MFKEDDPSNNIYLVKSGEFEIYKKITYNNRDVKDNNKVNNNCIKKLEKSWSWNLKGKITDYSGKKSPI